MRTEEIHIFSRIERFENSILAGIVDELAQSLGRRME